MAEARSMGLRERAMRLRGANASSGLGSARLAQRPDPQAKTGYRGRRRGGAERRSDDEPECDGQNHRNLQRRKQRGAQKQKSVAQKSRGEQRQVPTPAPSPG